MRGLEKQLSCERLKVNLLVSRRELAHVDTLDLYVARSRRAFLEEAAAELYVEEAALKRDLGSVLLDLELRQTALIRRRVAGPTEPDAALTEAERVAALELLDHEVEGPVALLLTTTRDEPDPELANRCLVLSVDEDAAHTAAIHARQRAVYSRAADEEAIEAVRRRQQHAQQLLEPLGVVIPWADQLTFRTDQTRYRRDHAKYLAWDQLLAYGAERAAAEQVHAEQLRFSQRELRAALGWQDRALRRNLTRLVELEYVVAYRAGRGNQRVYQLGAAHPAPVDDSLGLTSAAQLTGPRPR